MALVGSVREAVRRARANAPHVLRVVVEVDDMAQLDEALEAGAEGILLDNFQVRDLAEAVKRVRERRQPVVIEASGGVTLDRIHDISKTGVDVIWIGSITHSARAIDFSCEIRADRRKPGTRALARGVIAQPFGRRLRTQTRLLPLGPILTLRAAGYGAGIGFALTHLG